MAIEVVVERSGAQWTHLSPAPIMAQTLRAGFPDPHSDLGAAIRNREVVREAGLDRASPYIDEDDLAAVAVATLFEDGYTGHTLTVHGEPISLREQIGLVGRALQRDIALEELSPEEVAARARLQGMEEQEVQELVSSTSEGEATYSGSEYRRWLDHGIETVERVLGRPSRTYADWLANNVDALR